MKRQGVHMDGRIVNTQELAVAGITLGGLGGGARTKLEERSKARCYGERHPISVVNSDALQMFALAEAVHQALQIFVRRRFVELRLSIVLQAFREDLRTAGKVITQNATVGAYLVGSKKKGHYDYADNKRQNEFQGRTHQCFPLGKSEESFSDSRGRCESTWLKKERPSIATSSVLHDYVKSDVVSLISSIIDSCNRANFQSSLDFGGVVDQELKRDLVLALLYVDGKGSVPDG